ncbi:hypothetical protein P5V15_009567 [Pogonomyrmex californicus]
MSNSSRFQRQVKDKIPKRWWLLYATDFLSLMNPCFTLGRILGTFPYNIHASIFKASKLSYILSTIVTCVTCVYTLATLYKINLINTNADVARTIQDDCFFIFGSFIVILSYILSDLRMRLLQTILDISSRLPSKTYEKLSKFIHIKDIFGFFFLLSRMLIANNYVGILYKLEYYIGLQVFQMNMLYINCVCVLKSCFQAIDNQLTNLGVLMVNDNPCIPGLIYHEQKNPFLLIELKTLKKQHMIVSNAVQMLNIILGPQMLASIGIIFIELTFELYFNIVDWQNELSISLTKQIRNTFTTSYIMYHIIKLALIAWVCETGKNQAMKISTTVHDVINSTNDKKIKYELQLFSLQILHRDNTFSTRGLTVDARLITTMVGTITTYLLILIQFLIMMHSCDKNTSNNVTQVI